MKNMPKWLKTTLKVVSGIVGLFIVLLLAAALYISARKDALVGKLVNGLNNKISGHISYGSLHTSLFKSFPNVAVTLQDVELRDSLWQQHKHSLVKAKELSLALNIPSLLKGDNKITRLILEDGTVYIYKNPDGYSNTWLGKNQGSKVKDTTNKNPFDDFKINDFDLKNVNFVLDNSQKHKLFNFQINTLAGRLRYNGNNFSGTVDLNLKAKDFSFNISRGSFMKNRIVEGRVELAYDNRLNTLNFPKSDLLIGGDKFNARGRINMASTPTAFELFITAPDIIFSRAADLMANNIRPKVSMFKIAKPVKISCDIIETGLHPDTDPLIIVKMPVRDNDLVTPGGDLHHATFDGEFKNQVEVAKPIGDANSYIALRGFKGEYYNVPVSIAQLLILNLEKPVAHGQVRSNFNLTRLNSSVAESKLRFNGGSAVLDLDYKADIDSLKFVKPIVVGTVRIKNADMLYTPRNLRAVNSSLELNFGKEDLSLSNGRVQVGKSILKADLFIKNFLNFYYTDPEKVIANIGLSSPTLDLGDLLPLFNRKSSGRRPKKRNKVTSFTDQLTDVLEEAKVNLTLRVNNAKYNKFTAKNLYAQVNMLNNGLGLEKMHVEHAGGYLDMNGNLTNAGKVNTFKINTKLKNANVQEFFWAFDNFGQKDITSDNLRGKINLTANLNGNLTEQGQLVKQSLNGKANFVLSNAKLVNFKPLVNISKYIFKNRNLENVEFKTLSGQFTIAGPRITIAPMQINSSAINLDVKGIYSLTRGTNIFVDVPLRNPKKLELIDDPEVRKAKRMKGLVVHLNAVDGEDGKIKIKKSLSIN